MKKSPNRFILVLLTVLFASVFSVPILTDVEIPVFHALELKSRDLRFLVRGEEKPTGNVVIVAIDDRSIEAMGRWPWPRFAIAKLIDILRAAKTKAIGVDLIFSEREPAPELDRINQLITSYTELGLLNSNPENQAFFEEMAELGESADNDAMLSDMSRLSGNVIHTMAFVPLAQKTNVPVSVLSKSALPDLPAESGFRPNRFQGGIFPIPMIAESADRLGFANVVPDPDGSVRRGLAIVEYDGKLFASLPMCVALRYLDFANDRLSAEHDDGLLVGDYRLPVDANGRFFVNYYGPEHAIPRHSFVDVLTGNVSPDEFKDKCVFIGGAAVGLGDHWAAPFTGKFCGVELQATIADNILSQWFYRRPSAAKYVDVLSILVLGCVVTAFLSRLPILWCVPFSATLMLVFMVWNQYVFSRHSTILSCVWPLLNIGFVTIGVCLFRYITEVRENRLLKSALVQYLNPGVVGRI